MTMARMSATLFRFLEADFCAKRSKALKNLAGKKPEWFRYLFLSLSRVCDLPQLLPLLDLLEEVAPGVNLARDLFNLDLGQNIFLFIGQIPHKTQTFLSFVPLAISDMRSVPDSAVAVVVVFDINGGGGGGIGGAGGGGGTCGDRGQR